jgi:hypothetical protein
MSLILQTLTHLAAGPAAASTDPFKGVVPDFTIFGADFNAWWKKLLAGAWAFSIAYCAFKLFPAAMSVHRSRRVGNAMSLGEATQDLQFWGVGTAVIVAAGLLFGAILTVAG